MQARLVHFGSGDTITNEELWVSLGISDSLIYAFLLKKKKAVKNKVHILLVILDTINDAKVKKRYINQKY